ncbi:MAG: aminopeptidase P family N-terminal domain-containing protein, partial [bacterium]|nr:aminopeptidase P family N-terminal domain-containing protein [bacterium]
MNSNLLKIKSKLKKNSLDALLISSVPNIIYLTGFSGFSSVEREAFLLILKNKQYVLTDGRYKEEVENKMPDFELIELSSKNKLEKTLADFVRKHNLMKLGIEEENLSVLEYKKIKKIIKNLKDFNLNHLRSIKNRGEIENIKKACFLTDRTFKYILEQIKPGITEKKLVLLIELFIRENNADIA